MKKYLLIFLLLGFGFQNSVGNKVISNSFIRTNDEDKKKIILIINSGKTDNLDNEKGRSLSSNYIFAELYNGILSFSPYNIIGETFVLRIYDKEEEDVLWQKVCRYSELNNIILPNLPADTYVMTFETNEGVFATDIAL